MFASTAQGLADLHRANIVHGDLKPENIMTQTSGSDCRGLVRHWPPSWIPRSRVGS